ncbi:hypothetical protein LXL04_020231 [Taraxacum kok-saghyz]
MGCGVSNSRSGKSLIFQWFFYLAPTSNSTVRRRRNYYRRCSSDSREDRRFRLWIFVTPPNLSAETSEGGNFMYVSQHIHK